MNDIKISQTDLETLLSVALQNHNTAQTNAHSVAQALAQAQCDGQIGHGVSRIASYCHQAKSGKVDGHATPVVTMSTSAAVHIDAANGFAFPALDLAIDQLTTLAKNTGVSCATISRSHHFGVAGWHVERLAKQGCVGLIVGNSPAAIAPFGGARPLFGTNPIAFAAPRAEDDPLVIDLSLSKVARGKVMVAAKEGRQIPQGWGLDSNGQPSTDPNAVLEGSMLPMGDAKGAALVMMVEILAAALTGANYGFEASSFFDAKGPSPGVGQTVLCFYPESLSGAKFSQRLEFLINTILMDPGTRLPGTKRLEMRKQAELQGISVSNVLYDELLALQH